MIPNHYICVTGGRRFHNRDLIREILQVAHWFYASELRVIHGDAPGADTLAGSVCTELGIPVRAYPADWDTLGKKAGVVRNAKMADLLRYWSALGHTVQVVAFPGATGTMNMKLQARQRGIHVDEITA